MDGWFKWSLYFGAILAYFQGLLLLLSLLGTLSHSMKSVIAKKSHTVRKKALVQLVLVLESKKVASKISKQHPTWDWLNIHHQMARNWRWLSTPATFHKVPSQSIKRGPHSRNFHDFRKANGGSKKVRCGNHPIGDWTRLFVFVMYSDEISQYKTCKRFDHWSKKTRPSNKLFGCWKKPLLHGILASGPGCLKGYTPEISRMETQHDRNLKSKITPIPRSIVLYFFKISRAWWFI